MARFVFMLALLPLIGTAAAQRAPAPPDSPPSLPPNARPAPEATTLEGLYLKLKQAQDPNEARPIAKQIEQRWARSGSDTTMLLMERVSQAMAGNAHEVALELIDHILLLQPNWAEAYHRRATVMFMMDDIDGALRDIRQTLAREPRHYSALAGLGLTMMRLGQKKTAYAAYKKALEVHPQMVEVRAILDRMKTEIEGQDL
jgi:tetratricopeptide (TPR) repeat protein